MQFTLATTLALAACASASEGSDISVSPMEVAVRPGIASYMDEQFVSEVNAANFEEFKIAHKIVAIAFLPSSTAAPWAEFSSLATEHRDDYLFGVVTDSDLATHAGVTPPAIVAYRSFDEPSTEFPYPAGSATASGIEHWLNELAIPSVGQIGVNNYALYYQSGKPLAHLFLDPTDEKHAEQVALLRPAASRYRGKVNFGWMDAIEFADHARALNLNEAKWPSFALQDLKRQQNYPLDQSKDVTAEAIEELVAEFLTPPPIKSQPIPQNQEGHVFELVGKQFEEVVFDDSKDVFIEFYAAKISHCKRFEPTWESLGEHFAHVSDSLTIARMEATENDIPPSLPFHISSFPMLKFKRAGSHDFIHYDDELTIEALIAFVEENAANSLTPNDTAAHSHASEAEQIVLGHDHNKEHHKERHHTDEL